MQPKRLTPAERPAVAQHLAWLDDRDLRLRFGYWPAADALSSYVDKLDFERDALYGLFDDQLRLVALSHLAIGHDPHIAEFGVSVLKPHRHQGLGQVLMERSVEHAANTGVHTLVIQTLAQNKPMLRLMLKRTQDIESDGTERIAHLHLEAGSVLSHLHELAIDEWAAVDYLKTRGLRELRQLWRGIRHYRHNGALAAPAVASTTNHPLDPKDAS
jgi:GNAT superfamily N-acetyltransferase